MAEGPPGYLRVLIEHYDNLSAELVERWGEAAQEIEDRDYGPKKLVSDSMYFWMRAALGPWAPMLAGNPMAVPRLRLSVQKGVDEGEKTFVMALPGANQPVVTNFDNVNGNDKQIKKDKFTLTPDAARTSLKVEVTDLNALDLPVNTGYEGMIKLDGRALAILRVEIDP